MITHGEWMAKKDTNTGRWEVWGGDLRIARCRQASIDDARLIAAAPELLAALRELRYGCTDKAESMADAAISKALGA